MQITTIILLVTILLSVLALLDKKYFHRWEYNPYLVAHSNQYYRFVTHAFIHADWFHLFVNMYVLYNFGSITEYFYEIIFETKGKFIFGFLYLGGILFAALPAFKKHSENFNYNAVGASGAVSAVLFSAILFMPLQKIYIMFIPFGIPAFVFAFLYLLLEFYLDKKANDHVAHDAHIWGAIFGIVFTIALKPSVGVSFIQQVMGYLF
jgi:membrane associated rhomboid family serine protease